MKTTISWDTFTVVTAVLSFRARSLIKAGIGMTLICWLCKKFNIVIVIYQIIYSNLQFYL